MQPRSISSSAFPIGAAQMRRRSATVGRMRTAARFRIGFARITLTFVCLAGSLGWAGSAILTATAAPGMSPPARVVVEQPLDAPRPMPGPAPVAPGD